MNIKYYNCPEPKDISALSLPSDLEFLNYQPNWLLMDSIHEKFSDVQNFLVIGHGGSVTSFYAIYESLKEQTTGKNAYFLSTVDPDYIAELSQILSPEDTLVIAISKSGETTTQVEALLQFLDYPLLGITGSSGPLYEIIKNQNGELVEHPSIGGRFTAFTEVALLPALLCGLDAKTLFESGREFHAKFAEGNSAFEMASVMYQLEQRGIVDVFMPFYDSHLYAFSNLVVQLCHESFGKDAQGQTYFAHESPESQHHTNQRFFGGRKNIAGIFTGVENVHNQLVSSVPDNLKEISFKNGNLGLLEGVSLNKAMHFEREGTIEDANAQDIPVIDIMLESRNLSSVGNLLAFWQLYAIYSSLLRNVNPFDQPQVEASKVLSFKKRRDYTKDV